MSLMIMKRKEELEGKKKKNYNQNFSSQACKKKPSVLYNAQYTYKYLTLSQQQRGKTREPSPRHSGERQPNPSHDDRTRRASEQPGKAAELSHALGPNSPPKTSAKLTLGSESNGGDHGRSTVTKSMTAASQLTDSHSNPFCLSGAVVAAVVDYEGAGLGDCCWCRWWWWWWWWWWW